jgi:hypothetical protein
MDTPDRAAVAALGEKSGFDPGAYSRLTEILEIV